MRRRASGLVGARVLLLVMIGVMALGADFGGRMVYDYNASGTACRQPIQFTK